MKSKQTEMSTYKKSSTKGYLSKNIQQILSQLSRVWSQVDRVSDHDYFNKSNNLLIQLLELIYISKAKKPDWRSIYYKNLSVSVTLKNSSFALYYFRLVTLLSTELCLSRLVNIISQTNSQLNQMVNSKNHFNIKQFKINYFIDKNDERNFDFIEKIAVKFCKYIPQLSGSYEECEQLAKHYLMGLISNVDNSLKIRLKRIILVAFDSYCRLCVKNINSISSLKLNIFEIFNRVLDLYQNTEKNQQDYIHLYNLFNGFAALISTSLVVNYVKQFYSAMNIPETMHRLIDTSLFLQSQCTQLKFKVIIQTLCVSLMQSHASKYFFDLDCGIRQELPKQCCFTQSLIYLLWFHNQISNFKKNEEFSYYSEIFNQFQDNCQDHFNSFSQEIVQKIIPICIIDLNNFVKNEIVKVLRKFDMVNPQSLSAPQMKVVIKYLPLYKLMVSLFKNNCFKSNFQKIQLFYYQSIIYCLIFGYLINPNQKSLHVLCTFITEQYSIIYNLNSSPLSLLKLFHTLNRLSGTKHALMAFKCINKLISHIHIKSLLFQPKASSMFKVIRIMTRQFGQCSSCKKKIICHTCRQRSIFISKIIHLQMKSIISAFLSLSNKQRQDNRKQFVVILAQMMSNLIQYFHFMEDDSLQQICQLLVRQGMIGFNCIFEEISEAIKNQMFYIMQIDDFFKNDLYKQVLKNCLSLYKIIYQKKEFLTQEDKVKLIDCLFNAKQQLGVLLSKLKKQKSRQFYEDLQLIIDQIYALEYCLLERPALDYINHLSHALEERKNINFSFFVSVALKNIYFLLYSGMPLLTQTSIEKECNINNQDQNSSFHQFCFFENELEEMATKLKTIKQRCKELQIVFNRFNFKFKSSVFQTKLSIYQIDLQDDLHSMRNICCQLNDMMYVALLCGLSTFKEQLISYRLSLIVKLNKQSIYLVQIAKLILFQILPKPEEEHLKEQILKIINNSSAFSKDSISDLINLIVCGEANTSQFDQKRLFKLIYLLNNNPLVYINNIKYIINYLTYNIFTFLSFPFQIESQQSILKMTTKINVYQLADEQQYWTKLLWEEGWSYLRLMILFIRKILKKTIQLNESSRIKSFMKFSTVVLIRSGHLQELALPLTILVQKQKQINLLKVADSLRKIVNSQINASQYRKLDRILCDKRKSLSCGMNFEGLTKSISTAFKNAGNIGIVLCQIFMIIISSTFRVNLWQNFAFRSKMAIYQNDPIINFDIQTRRLLMTKDRQIDEEILVNKMIARRITQKLFQNYTEAVAMKQYIAEFINDAIDHYQSLSKFQNIQIQKIVVLIAVSFQQFNYTIKQFWSRNAESLSLNQATMKSLLARKQNLLRAFNDLRNTYQGRIENKITDLKNIKYPLSMLFPIGKYLFNLAWKGTFLMTVVPLTQFQDKVEVIQGIISSNNQILMSKQLNSSVNYKKRKGFDNQMGKVLSGVDIGIVDQQFNIFPASIKSELSSIHQALPKFLSPQNKNTIKHLRYFIKRLKIPNEQKLIAKFEELFFKFKNSNVNETNRQNENLLLYIHYKYLSFPFEAIKTLFQSKGVYRIPSIEYVLNQQSIDKSYNFNLCKYLINTRNDLPQTQLKFQSIKKRFPTWTGVKGRMPPLHQIIHLFDRDIFLFMGHGTGFDHIPTTQFIKFNPNCLMLVFGCSSSQMVFEYSEPNGCSFDFLLRGCPAYLGCLWNVTDIDIDKITVELFSRQHKGSLSYLLSQSKLKCSYPYLNGSALVIYGMPCFTVCNSNGPKVQRRNYDS